VDIKLNYELSIGLIANGYKRIVSVRYVVIKLYACSLVVGGVALAVSGGEWSFLAWIPLIFGPLTWWLFEWQIKRMAEKQLVSFRGPVETTITVEGVRQRFQFMTSNIGWELVKSVIETDAVWLLKVNPLQAIYLPKSAFSSEADGMFRSFLVQKQLLIP
jgi:hypothetical protein